MNVYIKLIGRENVIFLLILSVIFFATYWSNQLGLREFILLIIPQINSIFQIIIFSIFLLIGIPFLNTLTYYLEVIYFTKVNYRHSRSKSIVYTLRAIPALALYFSLTLPFLLILMAGFFIERSFNVNITHELIRTNGKINYASIITTVLLAYLAGHKYSNYIHYNYSAYLIEAPNITMEYLGNISGLFVIKNAGKILLVHDISLSKKTHNNTINEDSIREVISLNLP